MLVHYLFISKVVVVVFFVKRTAVVLCTGPGQSLTKHSSQASKIVEKIYMDINL